MGLTLSHLSALDATRSLRSKGMDLQEFDTTKLFAPVPWKGKRWAMREFSTDQWSWRQPSRKQHLDVLVREKSERIRMATVASHVCSCELSADSIIWLDEHASMVCPELMFCQMATMFSLPALVMLGYELCGQFSRQPFDPLRGDVQTNIPPATSVERIQRFLEPARRLRGASHARKALQYVSDCALSAPEAVLGTMYSLPSDESGYGMGPVMLNKKVEILTAEGDCEQVRFPDLLFPFAPIGINYEGGNHLDLEGIVQRAQVAAVAEGARQIDAGNELAQKLADVRGKYADDLMRNIQFASQGVLVFPAAKENLYTIDDLDRYTRYLLMCAKNLMGADVDAYVKNIADTSKKQDRGDVLHQISPFGSPYGTLHGKL